MIFFLETRQVV